MVIRSTVRKHELRIWQEAFHCVVMIAAPRRETSLDRAEVHRVLYDVVVVRHLVGTYMTVVSGMELGKLAMLAYSNDSWARKFSGIQI